MCTLSWLIDKPSNSYQLFFNRDELISRLPANPPVIHQTVESNFIAPIDGDAQGTWISVNDSGLALCLLNHYQAQQAQEQQAAQRLAHTTWRSRGQLVLDFAHYTEVDEITQQLKQQDLAIYKAFRLMAFSLHAQPVLYRWDGHSLSINSSPQQPITSSSFQSVAVQEGRKKQFQKLLSNRPHNAETLMAFHSSHMPEASAYSVCMHRDDACTQSFTHINVSSNTVAMGYADGPPCSTELSEPLSLPLKQYPVFDHALGGAA